ncbi:conjugal transfer protein TraJ, partial [Salmonella enterica subsp. enterica serovar Panama]
MAADNSARAIFIRGLLLLGMMLYLIYSLGFQNTDELKQQITQEVNASRSLISNDRWLS